ncbi:hypothetical protein B7463_g3094, partial [Scytalidium lignicola]
MSFGFGVGDFIAAIELANKIRKEFIDAPSQFKAISNDVRSLSIVLQDADVTFSEHEPNNDLKKDLEDIDKGCQNVLIELQRILDNNTELSNQAGNTGTRIKRVWKRFKWDPENIRDLRSRISTNIGLLNAFNGRFTRDNVVKLVQHQEDQRRQIVLDWITTINYAPQQTDFITRRQIGTGQWLLDSVEFQEWLNTKQRTLFCPGIPGAGKTILTSIVIDHLHKQIQNDPSMGISYVYCNFRRKDEQKAEDLLSSLLKQLTQGQSSLPESVKSLYDHHNKNQTRPSFDEISKTFQSVAAMYSRTFIIIDALDECQISNRHRTKFLAEIFAIQAKYGTNIFATSRFIPDIVTQFHDSRSIEIRAHDEDIRMYLDNHISDSGSKLLKDIHEEIKIKIIEAVDGMFLLAQLHFDSIVTKKTLKNIKNALINLPKGSEAYSRTYEEAMERIEGQNKDSKELAKRVISWITCAKRPLTTSELQHALAVELGEPKLDEENLCEIGDMVSVCAGLVTIDEESSIIRLVHYTTQEYFEQTQKRWFPNIHSDITATCATYLSFNEFESGTCKTDEELEERLKLNHFYNYASHNWGHHAREAPELIQKVISFLERNIQVEASSQVLLAPNWDSQSFSKQMKGIHLAAYFGIEKTVQYLLADNSPDSKDSYSCTPLSWAAGSGHEAVVKLLLENGVDPDSKDKYSWTPLSRAAESGHEAVVKLLLENGVDLNSKDYDGQTPLLQAAGSGHEVIVKLLLEQGSDPNIENRSGWTA